MLEVRSSYLVRVKDLDRAILLWKECQQSVWPILGWKGRIQRMLFGKAHQSLLVWSSEWESMKAWEAGMARTLECQEYKDWSREMNEFRVYGDEREIFTILEPFRPADCRSGAVEVRASYLVRVQRVRDAQAMARRAQEVVWPLLGFSGQHQQMLHGKASQSLFVWSSTWSSLSEWERATSGVGADEFRQWHRDWCEVADFGGPAEAFVNL